MLFIIYNVTMDMHWNDIIMCTYIIILFVSCYF